MSSSHVEQEFEKRHPTGHPRSTAPPSCSSRVLDSDEPLGVGDLAVAADLPKSTASRLLSRLERHGLVRRTGERGKLEAGPAILRFAHRGVVERNLVDSPSARSTSRRAQRRDDQPRRARPRRGRAPRPGRQRPLPRHRPVGRAPRRLPHHRGRQGPRRLRRSRSFPRPAAPLDGGTIVDRATLEAEFARVRAEAFATAIDELEPGLTAIAAPVHGPSGDVSPRWRSPARRSACPAAAGGAQAGTDQGGRALSARSATATREGERHDPRGDPQGPLRRHARRQRALGKALVKTGSRTTWSPSGCSTTR